MTEAESFRERCRLLLRLELEGDARVAQALLRDNDALCQNILEDPDRRRRILSFTDPKDAIGDGYDHLDDLIAGYMDGVTLERGGTIAGGASRCDFRYRRE